MSPPSHSLPARAAASSPLQRAAQHDALLSREPDPAERRPIPRSPLISARIVDQLSEPPKVSVVATNNQNPGPPPALTKALRWIQRFQMLRFEARWVGSRSSGVGARRQSVGAT